MIKSDLKRFPEKPFDAVLCVLALTVIILLSLQPFFRLTAIGLFVMNLTHWTVKNSRLFWVIVGVGFALVLSNLLVVVI